MSTDCRTPCPCARVNAATGPFGGEGGLRPPSQILALRVYNMPTVSTISRPRLLGADSVYRLQNTMPVCAGERCQQAIRWRRGPSAPFPNIGTSRLQHAHGVYNSQAASTWGRHLGNTWGTPVGTTSQHNTAREKGFRQCCRSMSLSSVAYAEVFPNKFLYKAVTKECKTGGAGCNS